MSERTKKILGFVALFAIAGLIGFGMYYLFVRGVPQIEPTPGPDEETGIATELPTSDVGTPTTPTPSEPTTPGLDASEVADGGLTLTTRLTSSAVRSATVTSDGQIAYYDPSDGRLYTIDENGNITQLSDARFPQAETVIFSDDAEVVAVEFPDGSNVIYDINADSQTTLPSHWEEFEFSPDSDEVVTKNITVDPSASSLVVTSTDGTSTEVIAPIGLNGDAVTLNWSPNGNTVGFSETGTVQTGFGRFEIFLIGADGEASGKLITEGTNFSAKWAPDSNLILYSIAEASSSYKPALWTTASDGSNRSRIGVQTWVEKCTFSGNDEVYCGVPREIPIGGGEDHNVVTAPDDLFKINLVTGRTTLVATPVLDLQMFDLWLNDSGDILYFTDENGLLNFIRVD